MSIEMHDPTDFETSEFDIVCRTKGCGNKDVLFRVPAASEDPVFHCGVCGNLITAYKVVKN